MAERVVRGLEPEALRHLGRVEDELASLRRELDHASRLATVGTLAAGVAHEVNNLLTPAMAYLQLAEERPHDDAIQQKAMRAARSGIAGAAKILQTLLGFASPGDSATGTRSDQQCSVLGALQSACDCLGDLEHRGIQLHADLSDSHVAMIDPLALQQVLLNLLLNSRRALAGRGGTISVSARRDRSQLVLTFSDDGPGIPPQIRDHVFEPFVTAPLDGGYEESPAGTGLGLAVCRRAVEQAGGSIAVESAPGRGATFTITLPAGSPQLVSVR
jgi:signal transduction histidine kinase